MDRTSLAAVRSGGGYLLVRDSADGRLHFPLWDDRKSRAENARRIAEELGTDSLEVQHLQPLDGGGMLVYGKAVGTAAAHVRFAHARELVYMGMEDAEREAALRLDREETPIRHVFWDFDGTLFDTYPAIVQSMRTALETLGIRSDEQTILERIKVSVSTCIEAYAKESGAAAQKIRTVYAGYIDCIERNPIRLYPGVERALERIRACGGKNYIYTHRNRTTNGYLKLFGMEDRFEAVVTPEDGWPRKPAPDGLLYLMRRFDLKPEQCVMIGDRDLDVLCGRNAQMCSALYDPEHFYGDLDVPIRADDMEELVNRLL